MSVEVNVVYEGQLRCKATHGPSGSELQTDAPLDNQGKGELFSPTDLVGTALGTCMLTIMGIVAQRNKYPIEGSTVNVVKEMLTGPDRRIKKLTVTFRIKNGAKLSEDDRKKLTAAAATCPVHRSIHPDVEIPIQYVWE